MTALRIFAGLMQVDGVRLRLEVVEGDACRKWHSDYTDLRLVATLDGPGTQFGGDGDEARIDAVEAGDVALFKGHLFGKDHALVPHRSPPIAGTGQRRLVLVIDTPAVDQPR